MKSDDPPRLLNARTGDFTPPGITFCARSNSAALVGYDLSEFICDMIEDRNIAKQALQYTTPPASLPLRSTASVVRKNCLTTRRREESWAYVKRDRFGYLLR